VRKGDLAQFHYYLIGDGQPSRYNDAMKSMQPRQRFDCLSIRVVLTSWAGGAVGAPTTEERWPEEKAQAWHEKVGWLVGCNFMPSTAINQLEMWQAEVSLGRRPKTTPASAWPRYRLLGGETSDSLKSAAGQQGLLQIIRDFRDHSNAEER
jgi:hypothetical protein